MVLRMRAAFNMKRDAGQQSGISSRDAAKLLSTGQTDELMDIIYNKYVEYKKQHDLVIVEGLSGFGHGLGNINELNAKVASTLETPVLLVLDSLTKQGYSSANDLANSVVGCQVAKRATRQSITWRCTIAIKPKALVKRVCMPADFAVLHALNTGMSVKV